ncbi:MAG: glycoside hydrolase family 27 protein [Candidatus Binatia bacterium]|jgi:alpha-galactosidase
MTRPSQRLWCYATVMVIVLSGLPPGASAQDKDLARTPPMGWNSWNRFGPGVSDAIVRAQAAALVASGMKAAGYQYVIIDDGWQGERDATGTLAANERFPDMKGLAHFIHSMGLKFGAYSSPGAKSCQGFAGSLGHEDQDAQTFASWGIDYLKYDWCGGQGDPKAAYAKMHDALRRTGRPIVYSICEYGMDRVWSWGASVGGNLWRTTMDIADNYDRMSVVGFSQAGLERFAGPGHWNDPDMLEVGNGGMNFDEYRTHMGLWCLLAAPLIAGTDLTQMKPETIGILTNPEVIAVDQDPAGIQGRRVAEEGPLETWVKPLSDGSRAVGLFNRAAHNLPMTASFRDIGVPEVARVRDLWARHDMGVLRERVSANVNAHGMVMLRVWGSTEDTTATGPSMSGQ